MQRVHFLPLLEQHIGRNTASTKTAVERRFGFGIDLDETHFIATFAGDGIGHRCETYAGAAPRGPKIDDNRQIVLQQLVKRRAGGVNNRAVQQRFTAAAAFGGIIDPVVRQAIGGQAVCTNRIIMLPLRSVTAAPGILRPVAFALLVGQFSKYGKKITGDKMVCSMVSIVAGFYRNPVAIWAEIG